MALIYGKLGDFRWLDVQRHPPLLQEECESGSCGLLFDIAG